VGRISVLQGILNQPPTRSRDIMQLIDSRTYPFLCAQTLAERQARDSLFKISENEFLLHMTSEDDKEDRLFWLDNRAALLWINQTTDEYGIDWE
jgi:hypothetical protein